MRVITGLARGHKLMTPEGVNTRPTTDRIKETLFNILAPYVMDSDFLDLFSGSGAIGIEALSRGARKAVFVEKDPKALAALKWNLSHTKLEQKAEVRSGNVHRVLEELGRDGAQFDLIYLDPPYHEGYYEPVLRQIMQQAEEACEASNLQILGGHTEVTRVVSQPLVSVTGVGKAKAGHLITTGGARPGMDILVTKWIGIEGTSIIAKEKKEELCSHFPRQLVETAAGLDQYLSVLPEAAVAVKSGVAAMHDVTEGGIFGALWEMAEASGVGLDIDLKKIPIRQETVEICEYFDINPYELISSGCMLMAAPDGNGLVMALERAGIPATVIGKATEGNDRTIRSGEEKRFLEPPKTDQLYQVM